MEGAVEGPAAVLPEVEGAEGPAPDVEGRKGAAADVEGEVAAVPGELTREAAAIHSLPGGLPFYSEKKICFVEY